MGDSGLEEIRIKLDKIGDSKGASLVTWRKGNPSVRLLSYCVKVN